MTSPTFNQNKKKIHRLAQLAVLFALCLVFSWFESLLPAPPGLPVKYGFSNIPVLYSLLALDLPSTLILAVLKAFFALMTRGATAGALSLAGGLCSVLGMALISLATKKRTSPLLLSLVGAELHNGAQALLVSWIFQNPWLGFSLLPVLILFGLAAGLLTGLLARLTLPLLKKPD